MKNFYECYNEKIMQGEEYNSFADAVSGFDFSNKDYVILKDFENLSKSAIEAMIIDFAIDELKYIVQEIKINVDDYSNDPICKAFERMQDVVEDVLSYYKTTEVFDESKFKFNFVDFSDVEQDGKDEIVEAFANTLDELNSKIYDSNVQSKHTTGVAEYVLQIMKNIKLD